MTGTRLTLGAVAAMAALAALGRRGSRSAADEKLATIYRLTPELVMRWANATQDGPAYTDPDEVEDFRLADVGRIPGEVRGWWERETGTRYLGHGNFRVVFSLGDGTVAKVALDTWGEDENGGELDAWSEHEGSEVGEFLAPLIGGDDRLVIMAEVFPLSDSVIKQSPNLARRFREREEAFHALSLKGDHYITDTTQPANWGVLDGKVVLIDYSEDR